MDIGYLITLINGIAGIFILIFGAQAVNKLKKAELIWATIFLLITGVMFFVHAMIEILRIGKELYAVSALIVTLLLGFSVVLFDINVRSMLGGE